MYKLSGKLKLLSVIFMLIGILGIGYGFLTTPSTTEDVKELLAAENHHGEGHAETTDEGHEPGFVDQARGESGYANEAMTHEKDVEVDGHGEEHLEHVLHQMQAKPWSATFVSAFFFFMIALGVLVFYAIQYVSQAGWSPVLYRIMEGITAYLLPGSIIVFLIVIFAGEYFYPWQNEALVSGDKILEGKSGYLNFPFFVIRAVIYLVGWNLYRFFSRRNALDEATTENNVAYRKNFKISVFFLLFFVITESTMSWDWFMSMTPHWYSTLFGWYIFATLFVSAITMIAMVTMFLKKLGHLPFVNDSHLHDLAKYMFAFSIFWTYLWFGQFMLIWYANIPEEVTYFILRIQEYNILFFGMLILNFVFPILMLMNSDYKRIPWFVFMSGIIVLVGHYIDVYLLIMPSTVGPHWYFGITEIASILFFTGLFIFVVGTGLASQPLRPRGNPFIKESENYHY